MSMYYCHECQKRRDTDDVVIRTTSKGITMCEICFENEIELETIAKQVDGNSMEIINLDKRIKKLENEK